MREREREREIPFILCHELLDVTGKQFWVFLLCFRRTVDGEELIQDN